jgi:RNA 2',3'-cyclic 3'-phosphodiesterase
VRLFLALDLDASAKAAIAASTAELRTLAPEFSWTAEPKLHLTLRFLGEQPDSVPRTLGAAMSAVAAMHRPFAMRLRGVGAFPNFRRARVVWMGVEAEPRLELLHHDVELACEALGFGLEGRPFRPHVTLARVREAPDEEVMRPFARAARRLDFDAEVMVEQIDLMQSKPTPRGNVYESLHAARLGRS